MVNEGLYFGILEPKNVKILMVTVPRNKDNPMSMASLNHGGCGCFLGFSEKIKLQPHGNPDFRLKFQLDCTSYKYFKKKLPSNKLTWQAAKIT